MNNFISHDTLPFAISSGDQWKLPAVNYIALLLLGDQWGLLVLNSKLTLITTKLDGDSSPMFGI